MPSPEQWLNALRVADAPTQHRMWKDLYAVAFPVAWNILRQRGATYDEVCELFQYAMTILSEKIDAPDFRLTAQPTTYLIAIIKLKWIHHLRYQNRYVQLADDTETLEYWARQLDVNFSRDDAEGWILGENHHPQTALENALMETIERMDADRRRDAVSCKELLLLFYAQHLDLSTIAQRLSLANAESAKVQKHKCMRKLHSVLAQIPLFKQHFNLS